MPKINPDNTNQPRTRPIGRRKRHDTERLFIALYPPADVVTQMLESLRRLRLDAPHRVLPREQIHLTLYFLGNVPTTQINAIRKTIDHATSGIEPPTMTPTNIIRLPKRGLARLLACSADASPSLYELRARLVARLAQQPRSRPNDRFTPHFTLCRLRSPVGVEQVHTGPVDQRVRNGNDQANAVTISAFRVHDVLLMRSTLTPEGADHHEVARFALDG